MNMQVKQISTALGAEITGIELSKVSDDQVEEIKSLLTEHKVIFFPGQNITQEEHVEYGSKFGELEGHPNLKNKRVPVSGKKVLYVNEHFTRRIVEMNIEESDMLLSYLTKWVTKPQFTVRYHWTEGTIAMWDNRSTQHYVVNDFVGERIIQRVTVMGDEVVGSSNPRWQPALREGFSAVTTHDKQLITHLKEKGSL